MSAAAEPQPAPARAARWRRVLRWAVWLAVLVALAATATWLTRERWGPGVLRRVAGPLAQRAGYEFELDGVRGDGLFELELLGVRLRAVEEGQALRSVAIERVHARYALFEALLGRASALESVEAQRLRVELDLTARTGSSSRDRGAAFELPARFPQIELEDAHLTVRLDERRQIEVDGLHLRVEQQGAFELGAPRVELGGEWPLVGRRLALSARGELSGPSLRVTSLESSGAVELSSGSGELDLAALREGAVLARLEGQLARGRFTANFERRDAASELRVELRELDVEPVLAQIDPLLAARLQGRVSCDGWWSGGGPGGGSAWAKIELEDGCIDGWRVEQLACEGGWSGRELWIAELRARTGDNQLLARGVSVPLAERSIATLVRGARGEFELLANDVPTLLGADPSAAPPHVAELRGRLDEGGVELSGGRLSTTGANFVLERGRVQYGAGDEDWLAGAQLDLASRARVEDFSRLGAVFGAPGWRGRAAGAVRLVGPRSELRGELDLVGDDVAFGAYELGNVVVDASLRRGRLDLARLRSRGALGELELSGALELDEQRFESLNVRLATEDAAKLAQTLGLSELAPYVTSGPVRMAGRLEGAWRAPDGRIELVADDALRFGERGFERVQLALSRAGERWTVEQLSLRSQSDRVSVRGEVLHVLGRPAAFARIEALALEHDEVGLALLEPASLEFSRGRLTSAPLWFGGSGGEARVEGHFAPDDLRVRLIAADLELLALLGPLAPPELECSELRGELELARDGRGWRATADLQAHGARWNRSWPLADVRVRGRADEERIELELAEVSGGAAGSLELNGWAQRTAPGPLSASNVAANLRGSARSLDLAAWPWALLGAPAELRGRLDGDIELQSAGNTPSGRLRIEAQGLELASEDSPLRDTGVVLAGMSLSLDARLDGELVLERCELLAPERVEISASGSLGGVAQWLADGARGPFDPTAPLELRAHWSIDDLRWLAVLTPMLRRSEGALSGEVVVAGAWGEPRAQGEWRWESGALRLGVDAPPFERIEAFGGLNGGRIEVERLTGELGGGPFELSGSVDLAGEGFIDLRLSGRELLVLRGSDLRARADAELTLRGAFASPTLSGRVGARDGRWRQRIEWLPSAPAPVVARRGGELPFTIRGSVLERLNYDVAIVSAGDFVIDTNLGRINLRPDLRLGGRADAPTLEGVVFLDPTRITLPGSTLELQAGTIVFDSFAPTTPTIDITATSRVLGYDVTARVSGRSDALERELTSSPPLRTEDISILLLTGRVPRDLVGNESGLEAAQTVILFLGKDLLSNWTGGDGVSLMERLEWRAGSDATRTGGATAQVSVRLTGSANGVGSAMYLRGERDVYDRINYGLRWVVRLK